MKIRSYSPLAACLVLAACAMPVATVSMKYEAPARTDPVWNSMRPVALGDVTDERGLPPRWFGKLKGSQNTVAHDLQAEMPIADLVRASIVEGLKARGASEGSASDRITVQVLRFECDKLVRREALVELQLTLRDEKGLPRFAKNYTSNIVDGQITDPPKGTDASVEDLRATMRKAMQQVVDRALDDAALQAVLLK